MCDINRYYLQSACVASHHCPNPASFCARLRKHLIIIIIIINTLHFLQPQALHCLPAVLDWAVKRVLTIVPRESNARSSERVWRRAAFFFAIHRLLSKHIAPGRLYLLYLMVSLETQNSDFYRTPARPSSTRSHICT